MFNPLVERGLLKTDVPVSAAVLLGESGEVKQQLVEFGCHLKFYSQYLKSWLAFHDSDLVRDGWKYGVKDQDPTWEGVPKWLAELIRQKHELVVPAKARNAAPILAFSQKSLA